MGGLSPGGFLYLNSWPDAAVSLQYCNIICSIAILFAILSASDVQEQELEENWGFKSGRLP